MLFTKENYKILKPLLGTSTNIVILFLVLSPLVFIFLYILLVQLRKEKKMFREDRFKFVIVAVLLFSLLASGSCLWGLFIEPHLIIEGNYEIDLDCYEGDEIKIVAFGDPHMGKLSKGEAYLQRVVEKVNEQDADYVFLLGDYVDGKEFDLSALDPLGEIEAKYGVYAILGNHDYDLVEFNGYPHGVADKLRDLNIRLLDNEVEKIGPSDTVLAVGGIEDLWAERDDLNSVTEAWKGTDCKILLSHNPDVIDEEGAMGADLIFAGHTHGGQIRLPLLGPVLPIPTKRGREYDKGLYELDENTRLLISSGVGEAGTPMRLFNAPEVVVVVIE